MQKSGWKKCWKGLALAGTGLVAIGLGDLTIDFMTTGSFAWAETLLDTLMKGALLGGAVGFAGFIGWAWCVPRARRFHLAVWVFGVPAAATLLISLAPGGTNVHGIFPVYVFATFVAALLATILFILAAFSS